MVSYQVAQQNQGTESWEHTRALSLIILRIEKASLIQIKHVKWLIIEARTENYTANKAYVKVTANGSPSGTATTTIVT